MPINKKTIKILVISALITIFSIFFIDIPLATFVHNSKGSFLPIVNFFTNFASLPYLVTINIILVIIYCIFKIKKHEKFNTNLDKLIFFGILTQIILPLFLRVLKFIFGRMRPFELDFQGYQKTFMFFKTEYEFSSFPSGHSFSAWIFIVCLLTIFRDFFRNKLYFRLLLIYGFGICATRVMLNVHYFSDVFIGSILGIILTNCLMGFLVRRYIKIAKD